MRGLLFSHAAQFCFTLSAALLTDLGPAKQGQCLHGFALLTAVALGVVSLLLNLASDSELRTSPMASG